ncbi:hypothetical protein [Providencia manganoxydans]|uniref:phage tail tube protein n=1 Tax=Providencia manganoxydans TaxID=2923283 RepID=UPI0034E60233
MQQPETYYYGQGRLFLAERDEFGRALAQRFIGDVSVFNVTLSTEKIEHKESYSGYKGITRRIALGNSGEIDMTWHDLSGENLALLLYGKTIETAAGSVTGEKLPANIKAGERYTLAYPSVSDVVLTASGSALVLDEDYLLDEVFGAITFTQDQTTAPEAAYKYSNNTATSLFTQKPKERFLRYEGVNLAEEDSSVILELYKVQFDPVSNLGLINNETNLAGLQTKGGLLMDTSRKADDAMGRFGKLTYVNGRSA